MEKIIAFAGAMHISPNPRFPEARSMFFAGLKDRHSTPACRSVYMRVPRTEDGDSFQALPKIKFGSHVTIHSSTHLNNDQHPDRSTPPAQVVPVGINTPSGALLQLSEARCPLLHERFSKLKQSIIKDEDHERVIQSYHRLTKALQTEAGRIAEQGPNAIPRIDFAAVEENGGRIPDNVAGLARQAGCIILKGVVPEQQASQWEADLKAYTKNHPNVAGWPKHDPQNFSLFWTPAQVQIRSHPRVMQAMNAVSQLWHVSRDDALFDLASQVVYADRFRIRHPSMKSEYPLPAHQDSGAIERWEDAEYRSCYQKIFEGRWEDYDAWNADHRDNAKTDLYPDGKSTTAFRSLQGWLSLSHTNTGEGTLRVVPELKLSTAYQLLRPYFILDETFDPVTPLFPGANPGSQQFRPTTDLHPHLLLEKAMVGIPPVKPGDYVFWHCDTVHEVDRFHPGTTDSSVSYNPCVPLCPYNLENLMKMRYSFGKAEPPEDFATYDHAELEKEHEDHGAKRENILSVAGLRALGFESFDAGESGLTSGQREMRALANQRLGFASA